MIIPQSFIDQLKQQKIIILGLGREGLASYQFLRKILPTQPLAIADQQTFEQFGQVWQERFLQDQHLELHLGKDHLAHLSEFSLVIKSPGIPANLPAIKLALHSGAKLSSNTQLLFELINQQATPNLSIGVTGTKGKSTTSSLIYHVLNQLGLDAVLIGNIGQAPLAKLEQIKEQTIVVLELSCHQLAELPYSPNIAVIQNITSEHLDYYPDTASYVQAKSSIARYQKNSDFVIYNPTFSKVREIAQLSTGAHLHHYLTLSSAKHGDPNTNLATTGVNVDLENQQARQMLSDFILYIKDNYLIFNNSLIGKIDLNQLKAWQMKQKSTSNNTIAVEEKVMAIDDLPLLGKHNLYNVMPAVIIAKLLLAKNEQLAMALKSFKPLPHRLELVQVVNGVKYVNDSLATMPDASVSAIKAFEEKIILLAGGYERHQDFNELAKTIVQKQIKALILFPSTGERLKKLVLKWFDKESEASLAQKIATYPTTKLLAQKTANQSATELLSKRTTTQPKYNLPQFFEVNSMTEAVTIAKKIAQGGDVVLLSPASASFGVFKDYADRGEQFRREVERRV